MAGSGSAHLRGDNALLSVHDLVVDYPTKNGIVQAVSRISFDVMPGETLGIVGESGCGKSTTGRAVLRLDRTTSGSIRYGGARIDNATEKQMRRFRSDMQMIFQDPVGSLNPRRRVKDLVVEALTISGVRGDERARKAAEVLQSVGLSPERHSELLPRALSGGQAQRVAIARALALGPRLLVCDEPVSALDVSVQAQILNLIEKLKDEYNLTVVFIAHDLGVVRTISDNVMVMYLGKVCESGDSVEVYRNPAHPYTRALLDSVPRTDSAESFGGPALQGDVPSPVDPPSGCRFRTRCPRAETQCAEVEPQMAAVSPGHFVACHFPLPRTSSANSDADHKAGTRTTAQQHSLESEES